MTVEEKYEFLVKWIREHEERVVEYEACAPYDEKFIPAHHAFHDVIACVDRLEEVE